MIGVFDSGIGGLTVVRALMDRLPNHDLVYLGDTARTPYGNKSAQTIVKYSLNNTAFLLAKGAEIIVIACNTASSYAFDELQAQVKVPVFEVIGPGARLAVERSPKKRIGVIGTRATVASGVYTRKILAIEPRAVVFAATCPLLVPLVEEGWGARRETTMIVRKYLQPLKMKQIDTLILGCTHYPVLKEVIQRKIGKRVKLIDSAQAIATQIEAYYRSDPQSVIQPGRIGSRRIFVTDNAGQFRKTAHLILREDIPIEQADL
jgi:glutamate racemase